MKILTLMRLFHTMVVKYMKLLRTKRPVACRKNIVKMRTFWKD